MHNAPILVTAELGIPIGSLFLASLLSTTALVVTRRGDALVVFVAVVPMLLFDHLLVSQPIGLIMLGFWLASLAVVTQDEAIPLRDQPRSIRGIAR